MGDVVRWPGRSQGDPSGPTALVDHWYSHAVGHVIEALRRCQGYRAADETLRIGLVLNGASPTELARCVPFVERVYPVSYTSFGTPRSSPRAALRRVPREWDYVLRHPSSVDADHAALEGLSRYYAESHRRFRARIAEGLAGGEPPSYVPHQQLRLDLPAAEREQARRLLAGRRSIVVVPAGSGTRALYPSTASWTRILDALAERFPGVVFAFVGRLAPAGGRTVSGIGREEVDRLVASCDVALDLFDRPLLEQLAVVEASDLFVSPHTGFGFAAVAVGTPWLTLSGGDWHEHFFNGVPFYSVLPKGREQPAFVRGGRLPMVEADEDGEGARTWTMRVRRIEEDLDELVEAAALLRDGRLSYEDALAGYFPRLLDAYGGDRSLVQTFEDVHAGYV